MVNLMLNWLLNKKVKQLKNRSKRVVALTLVFTFFCQILVGCGDNNSQSNGNQSIQEEFVEEQFVFEDEVAEEKLTEEYIVENMVFENGIYEYQLTENIIAQTYVIEITVGELSEEEILNLLPPEIDEYNIDWPRVIAKFAVGTSIIIAVGVISGIVKTPAYFVMATPAEVSKEAFAGGAILASLNVALECASDETVISKKVQKYAIEGFADGYMWGAIESVLRIEVSNIKRLNAFKLATGAKLTIKADGTVYDTAGKLIGKAVYDKDGIWHLIDEVDDVIRFFDSKGKELLELAGNKLPANTILKFASEVSDILYYTDDVGNIMRAGDDLLPNITYQLDGHKYTTDKYGRIEKVVFDNLQLKPEGRSRLTIAERMSQIGKGDALVNDQRGHLIADRFDGNNTLANIVPMSPNANQVEVAEIEAIWAKCLEQGGHVSGTIEIVYSKSSFRPIEFIYTYDIGNGMVTKVISNAIQ